MNGIFRKCMSAVRRFLRFFEAAKYYTVNAVVMHVPLYSLRHFCIRHVLGITVGGKTAIHMGVFVTGNNISIGENSIINRRCYLDGRGELLIGDNVSVSPDVYVITATHDLDDERFKAVLRSVNIEDYVWIGARAIILPGVTLARGSVVGAGSVVTRSTEPFTVVAGNPARKIKDRSETLTYQLRYFPWFDTDIGGL